MKSFKNYLLTEESNNTAKNLKNVYWKSPAGITTFQATKNYGIVNPQGQALSSDGIEPTTYRTLKIAKEIALYADGFDSYTWIDIYVTREQASVA